jgi:hypothetical protein
MPDSFVKAPAEVLPYKRDWKYKDETSRAAGGAGNGYLDTGETISTSTWTVPAGITKDSETHADGLTTVWISGGTLDTTYRLVNTIVTSAGRTAQRSIEVSVQTR